MHALARRLGADVGVDYGRRDWIETVRDATGGVGPDVIYESVGGSVTRDSLEVLAPEGRLVVYGALNAQDFHLGVPELLGLVFKNQSLTGFALAPLLTPETLKTGLMDLFDLAVTGNLDVRIGGIYPLEHVGGAHRREAYDRKSGARAGVGHSTLPRLRTGAKQGQLCNERVAATAAQDSTSHETCMYAKLYTSAHAKKRL